MHKPSIITLPILAGLLLWTGSASAITVDVTSGTSGTNYYNQSFNETRGVDVYVLGSDLAVSSMTLNQFNIGTATGTVGARIYNSDGSLRASADLGVFSGFDQSVSIPISTVLNGGSSYRVGFFIDAGGSGGSGDFLDPVPSGLSLTPYTDSTGTLRITGAFQIASDSYPTNINGAVPLMTLEVQAVPLPATVWLFGSGLLGLVGIARRKAARNV